MMKSKNFLFLALLAVAGTLIMIIAVSYMPIPGLRNLKNRQKIELPSNSQQENKESLLPQEGSNLITEIISEQILNDALACQKPIIIKVYHNFCPPCVRAKAAWPNIAKQFEGKIAFYSLNVAQQELTKMAETKELFSLSRLPTPTFILRNNGKNINKIEGFGDAETLSKQITSGFNF
ncbi:thioredoxin family protein [Candidatus Babeliales bacterium]|nr:thioredoxin family protein [Candidatus Babeliales bacterium]